MGTAARGLARTGRWIREILLTLAALGGIVCIVLTLLAFTGGYSLIMFKTGSMSPTIPAGSVALVQKAPASDLRIGDVVTVDRAGALPVTHRITSVSPGPSHAQRVVTLRGDANETDDPAPYTITDARIVRGSLPHLAHVIVWFGSPWVLGTITVAAAALVTWAFWPRRPRGAATAETAPTDSEEPTTRRGRRAAGLLTAVAILAAAGTAFAPVPPASATGIVSIRSSLSPGSTHLLDATDPLIWDLDVDAQAAPDDGALTVDLSGQGDPHLQLNAEVRSCDVPWTASGCAGTTRVLAASAALALGGARQRLLHSPTPDTVHLRVFLTATVHDAPSATATLTVRATAAQTATEETLGGSAGLPATGGTSFAFLLAPAAVLIGLGVALVARRRREAQ
ncbi:signal peptidase I [Microbacterium sp. NPDC057659]|uniref:signal peptidase I n=1 Tax=Microbacterium sp. NPDC057659 TaxID=3346198 RepID=UPI00366F69C5